MRRPIGFMLLAGVAALVVYSPSASASKRCSRRPRNPKGSSLLRATCRLARKSTPALSNWRAGLAKACRPAPFTPPAALLNRFTRTDFVQKEPLIADRLFDVDKNADVLPPLISNGMRAMSVAVDEVGDIAGFVMPHAGVDVLVSTTTPGVAAQPFSKIVLSIVQVLAVAQQVEDDGAEKPEIVRVVTLLVVPDDAERLALASHEGALRLALRNYTGHSIVPTSGIDVTQMLQSEVAGSCRRCTSPPLRESSMKGR